jgi:hypothetical protein
MERWGRALGGRKTNGRCDQPELLHIFKVSDNI